MYNKTANKLAIGWAILVAMLASVAAVLGYEPVGGWQPIDVLLIMLFAVIFPLALLFFRDNNTLMRKLKTGDPATQVRASMIAGMQWEVVHIGVLSVSGGGYVDVTLGKELKKRIRGSSSWLTLVVDFIKRYPFYGKRGQALAGVVLEAKELKGGKKLLIPFRPAHPSMGTILTLTPGTIIGFNYQKEPMMCALPFELCAYLSVEMATPTEQSVN